MGGQSDDPGAQRAKKLLIGSRLPSIWLLSVILSAAIAVLAFVIPLKSNNKEEWSAGPLTVHHRFLGTDCQSCHEKPFQRVLDTSCTQCHSVGDHPALHNSALQNAVLDPTQSCVSCHHEHHGEEHLTLQEDSLCISCHASLSTHKTSTKLNDVPSFEQHPDFVKRSDRGSIKVNHRVHLGDKIRGPNGYEKLTCADCHHPQQDEKLFEKVSYARDCARCHPLDFDETVPVGRAPHAPAHEVVEYLFGEFAKQAELKGLGAPRGRASEPLTRPSKLPQNDPFELTQRIAGRVSPSPVLQKTRQAEEILFTKTGCILCHVVSESSVSSTDGEKGRFISARYKVEKSDIPHQWLTKARFDHAAHTHLSCESCHATAAQSEKTSDVLLPALKGCQECHGMARDEKGRGGLQSACIACHVYHPRQKEKGNEPQ